jgi:hypothetical protein
MWMSLSYSKRDARSFLAVPLPTRAHAGALRAAFCRASSILRRGFQDFFLALSLQLASGPEVFAVCMKEGINEYKYGKAL